MDGSRRLLPGGTNNSMGSGNGIMPLHQQVAVWPRMKCSPPKHEALDYISLGSRHLIVFPETELCSCANTDGMVKFKMAEKLETRKQVVLADCILSRLVLFCIVLVFGICIGFEVA